MTVDSEDGNSWQSSVSSDSSEKKLQKSERVINLLSMLVMISGAASAAQPLYARLLQHPKLFSIVVPYSYYHFGKSLHVLIGTFLVFLSFNLLKRKERAWRITVALSVLAIILQIAHAGSEYTYWLGKSGIGRILPFLPLALSSIALCALWSAREKFKVRSESGGMKEGLLIAMACVVTAIAYGTFGFWLLDKKDLGVDFQWLSACNRTLRELTMMGNEDLDATTLHGRWFLNSLRICGAISGALAMFSLFRPIRYRLHTEPAERNLARTLLDSHGRDALDNYKSYPDKSFFFLPAKTGFISYRAALGVGVGLGDPAASSTDIASITADFREFCHGNDWQMAFLQVSPRFLDQYREQGLAVLKVGEDAIVDLEKFSLETVRGKNFKSKVNKFTKEGYELVRHEPPHDQDLLSRLEVISRGWLSLPGRKERGFSLGWFSREDLESSVLYVLYDPDKREIAFVNQVRSYAPEQVSIDMMRHLDNVPNGTMDFLFARLLCELHNQGFKSFNLGLAALSGVGEDPEDPLEARAVHEIYEHMNRFFSYKGLRHYKEKFKPDWEERFLIYEGGIPGLLRTALAIAKVGDR